MTKLAPVHFRFSGIRVGVLAALVIGQMSLGIAATVAPAGKVISVQPTRVADLVLLEGGFDAGLRQGMVCRVTRENSEIAEILLVELRPTCSAALITALTHNQSIRSGDLARIKILKT